ncbi:hypothetical protein SAMN00017405_1743 [Desulfonispora thiosulfatigenes DSM 11270]|uniref:PilZ domain-containing protein n=1 Tax=Desulfonispora thiosulfatigenes DSM 11270 TaxID=656914 RepID=A0A1W1V2X9_DESTI|nr:PilZ domain-containing protein [Desulfonispora thiosulfatigenes]SMB87685.1 hypothetical protein SAMN00017405_1743 [Desulfonispora thiosulfatigenes DSM 11270]
MRKDFRIDFLEPLEAKAILISIGQTKLNLDKCIPIKILNLSCGGIKAESLLDVPMENQIIAKIVFEFENHSYQVHGQFVWKENQYNRLFYGINFIGLTPLEEERLRTALNNYQAQKIQQNQKMKIHKINMRRNLKPLIRLIKALPQPVFLVTEDRKIVDFNFAAQKQGCLLEGTCYKNVWDRPDPCPFCQLKKAKDLTHFLDLNLPVEEEEYFIRWFYLGDGVYYHSIEKAEKSEN